MLTRASIRFRLTLWYVVLLAVILAVFAAGVYLMLRQALYNNLEESILARANVLLAVIQYEGDRPFLPDQISVGGPGRGERFVRLFDASGALRFDYSRNLRPIPVDAEVMASALEGDLETRSVKVAGDDDPLRVTAAPVRRGREIVGVLEVGQSEDDVLDTLGSLLLIMGLAYPVALFVASFGGVFLAGRALSPVDNITRAASDITEEGLNRRLDLSLPDDEIGRLARTFDDMIARLESAFQRQRQFTADASHELRTPLTIIKGQIEVSLQREREPEAYRRVLQAVNEEVDRLIRLAGSLLILTRADSGQIPLAFETLDVGELVAGVCEQISATAAEKGVAVRQEPGSPVAIRADQDLALQLMLNLLDNAIKYTPSGGAVDVAWALEGSQVELKVRDTGIGIAREHVPYLFDRFYRVDRARSRADGGVGLGLAICRWIAEAHGGSIRVESDPGWGSTFTVRLPAAPA